PIVGTAGGPSKAARGSADPTTTRAAGLSLSTTASMSFCGESTATATTVTSFGSSFFSQVIVLRHGGHHVAQNSTSTGLPRNAAKSMSFVFGRYRSMSACLVVVDATVPPL